MCLLVLAMAVCTADLAAQTSSVIRFGDWLAAAKIDAMVDDTVSDGYIMAWPASGVRENGLYVFCRGDSRVQLTDNREPGFSRLQYDASYERLKARLSGDARQIVIPADSVQVQVRFDVAPASPATFWPVSPNWGAVSAPAPQGLALIERLRTSTRLLVRAANLNLEYRTAGFSRAYDWCRKHAREK